MKVKDKRLTRNAARCENCGTVLESQDVHDLVSCPCGNFVDGGLEYTRRGGNLDQLQDLSEYEDYEREAYAHELVRATEQGET